MKASNLPQKIERFRRRIILLCVVTALLTVGLGVVIKQYQGRSLAEGIGFGIAIASAPITAIFFTLWGMGFRFGTFHRGLPDSDSPSKSIP